MLQRIRKILSQKKGAVAVLLMCIMGSFILIISVLVAASVSASGKSYADAAFQLSGKSILSEYDRKLLDEYGLLCFRGDETDIKNKIKYYTNGSFDKNQVIYSGLTSNKDRVDLMKMNLSDVDVTLKEYSMVNVDLYEDQIKEALKTTLFKDKKRIVSDNNDGRILKNEIVIESLPSSGYEKSFFPDFTDAANIPSWEEVKNRSTNKFARCEYALNVFKYANGGGLDKKTFFNNEIEYILEGKLSDKKNYAAVKAKLITMRYSLNAVYLLTDKAKMAMITAHAAATGPATPAAQAIIFAAWVAAETDNDIGLLEKGDNVALLKTSANWALNDIVKVMEELSSENVVNPGSKNGLSYNDYLRLLLYSSNREVTLLRMMDLTQINMKGVYYRDFLLKEYYAGFRFKSVVKGDGFNYVQHY